MNAWSLTRWIALASLGGASLVMACSNGSSDTLGDPPGFGGNGGGGGDNNGNGGNGGSANGGNGGNAGNNGAGGSSSGGSNAGGSGGSAGSTHDAGSGDSASDSASDVMTAGIKVDSFTLIDTAVNNVVNGQQIAGYDPIADGSTISLAKVGVELSIRANVSGGKPGSLLFTYGMTTHTENAAPYMLCGDDGNGNITNCNLKAGAYTLTAIPFADANLDGGTGTSKTIKFTITN